MKTWIHGNLCYLTINCDTGQHSQFLRCLCLKTKQFKDTLFYEASLSVSKLKLVGGNNEWEGNIMVGGKPVCDDGAKKHGKAAAQVVCRFIFFWSISSQIFTITIIFLDAVACQMSTMSKCPNVRCKKICPDSRSVEISSYQSRSNEICLVMSIKLS